MADGFELLQRRLRALSGEAMRKSQRKALGKVGKIVQAAIVERAPVKAESARGILAPGELKASIKARVSVPDDAGTVQGKNARVVIGPKGSLVKLIAADVEYGHDNPKATGKKMKRTPAHPFIRPAKDTVKIAAEIECRRSLMEDVKKAMASDG